MPHTSDISPLLPAIERRAEEARVTQRLPGLCLGIVLDQELAWSRGFGAADLSTGRPPDEHTRFRVASITKTLTTAAVMQLRDLGHWSLEDPLVRHLPEFSRVAGRAGPVEAVTLRRLLTHHSGLATEAPFAYWQTLEFPGRERLLESLAEVAICLPADAQFKYSNLAFGLLGEAVARAAGCPFDQYLDDNILKPLGMRESALRASMDDERMAQGYCADPFSDELSPAPAMDLRGLAACGQLITSVHDLAKWVALQFRTEAPEREGSQILKGATIAECHRPHFLEPNWSAGYCLGWRANRFGERVYLGHGGALFGFSSYVLFSKACKFGVICLGNLWPHPGLMALAAEIADVLCAHFERSTAEAPRLSRLAEPDAGAGITGLYAAAKGIFVVITRRNGRYFLEKAPGAEYLLHAPAQLEPTRDPAVWIVHGGRAAGEHAHLEFGAGQQAVQFTLGGFVYKRVIPA
jgi:CubicO group peptidase (beta-lactamase class C family)